MSFTISLHSQKHLLLSTFLIIVILIGVKWSIIVILICFSLMINDGKYFLLCLLIICIYIYIYIYIYIFFFLDKCPFLNWAIFL